MTRIGGPIPDSYGLSLTVKCAVASEAAPIDSGDPLVFDSATAYGVLPAPAGAVPAARAKHTVTDPFTPLGVHVFGFSRLEQFTYTGAAPAIGGSIESNGTGGVRAAVAANATRVLFVDTARSIVEVLLP